MVIGVVEEQFYGTKMYMATRVLPSISTRAIDMVDCKSFIIPSIFSYTKFFCPSPGGLYPLTMIVEVHRVKDITAGIYCYDSQMHSLGMMNSLISAFF